jgi:hypothetical protein
MSGRADLRRRLRRGAIPVVVAGLAAGTLVLTSGSDEQRTSVTASGTTSWADSGGTTATTLDTTAPAAAPVPAVDEPAVLAATGAAASAAGGTISVVVRTGDGVPLVTGTDSVTYTASLAKLFVVTRLLALDEAGAVTLSATDLALMESAVTRSDDDAMSALWVRHDGARLVTDLAAGLGLTSTAAPVRTGQWGQTTTSATDLATVLGAIDDVLDPADAAMLRGWMRAASPTAADGFDQAFGLLSGSVDADRSVAVKQGWMCCVDGRRQLHSVGILADGRVVVLLGDFPSSTSWARAATALDEAATAVVTGTG